MNNLLLELIVRIVKWRGKQFAYELCDRLLIEVLEQLKKHGIKPPMGLECAIGFLEELL